MSEIRPVELERLSRRQVERSNLLAARCRTVSLLWSGREMRLVFTAMDRPPSQSLGLRCLAGDAPFALSIGEAWLREFYPDGVADIPISSLPGALASALARVATGPLLEGLEACLGGPVTFEGLSDDVSPDWHLIGLSTARNGSAAPLAGIHLSPEAELKLTEFLRAQPKGSSWPGASSVPVPLRFCLRSIDLSGKEYAALRLGGAILLPPDIDPARLQIRLGAGSRLVGFGRAEGGLVVVEKLMDDAMNEDDQELLDEIGVEEKFDDHEDFDDEETFGDEGETHKDIEKADVSLDEIDVRVDFMLGQTKMTVSELQALAPGFSIELDRPISHAVNILVSGKVIGEGELVQIDDRLGVRIVRLVEKKDG